ncbi:MAG TPA: hypothetical protein VGL97_15340 [Bryobacteraceae bacterium]
MDSRSYLFIYALKGNTGIPADFAQEIRSLTFETGVFMPQDESNWFTRPPKYPARLLLLEKRSLHIVPHPSSGQLPVEIKLDDLLQLETGCILLFGWMKFTTRSGTQYLVYNTRASRPLEKFLATLKRRWLGTAPIVPNVSTRSYGDELDVKFRYSMRDELDKEEGVLVRYFEVPVPSEKKALFFRRVNWRPGNLILLTSWNRIVWITDHYRGRRELYASASFSAPSALLNDCRAEETDGREFMVISFASGINWRIPLHEPSEGIRSICQIMNQLSETLIASNKP